MTKNYENMKRDAGLENASCSSEDLDEETEAVLR